MPGLTIVESSSALCEHSKGMGPGGLEGMLRSEAYPSEVKDLAEADPDFRHGTLESGGETPNEAGTRLLDGWLYPLLKQPNFQPRTNPNCPLPTVIAFGHNLITAMALEQLYLGEREGPMPPVSHRRFRASNATGLLVAEHNNTLSVLSERLLPTAIEFEEAQAYIAST